MDKHHDHDKHDEYTIGNHKRVTLLPYSVIARRFLVLAFIASLLRIMFYLGLQGLTAL